MKKVTILASVLILIASNVMAQSASTKVHAKHGKQQRQQMAAKLNLSDDQKSKLKTINQGYHQKAKDIKSNDALPQGEAKKELKTLKEQRKSEMGNVFTADQKNIIQKEKKNKADQKFTKMKEKLSLSDNQVATLEKRRAEVKANIAEIKANSTLSSSDKKEKIKDLKQSQKEYLKTVLTAEQLAKIINRKG